MALTACKYVHKRLATSILKYPITIRMPLKFLGNKNGLSNLSISMLVV